MVPVYYPLRRGLSAVGSAPPCQGGGRGFEPRSPLHAFPGRCESAFFIWRSGQVVRHGPAKPLPPVRIRASPPEKNGTRSCGCLFCCAGFLARGFPAEVIRSRPRRDSCSPRDEKRTSGEKLTPEGLLSKQSRTKGPFGRPYDAGEPISYEISSNAIARAPDSSPSSVFLASAAPRTPTRRRHRSRRRSSRAQARASPAAPRSPSPRACAQSTRRR